MNLKEIQKLNCKSCNVPMKIGIGLQGQEDFYPGVKVEYNYKCNTDLILTRCWKCPKCGFSESL